jgi:histone H3/H4
MARLLYVQKSKVRRFINERGMKVSKSYIDALDREVMILMEKHLRIAKADRRKTVMVVDIDLPAKIASLSRDLKR